MGAPLYRERRANNVVPMRLPRIVIKLTNVAGNGMNTVGEWGEMQTLVTRNRIAIRQPGVNSCRTLYIGGSTPSGLKSSLHRIAD